MCAGLAVLAFGVVLYTYAVTREYQASRYTAEQLAFYDPTKPLGPSNNPNLARKIRELDEP